MNPDIKNIQTLFARWGEDSYSELVSQVAHAEQCAALATAAGANDAVIIAALLHDIGHLLVLDDNDGHATLDVDDNHESTGARFLATIFGPHVAAPVALHVAAKRYLCSVEPSYFDTLSPASVSSLAMQGGPMSADEVHRFSRLPQFQTSVDLRRWDDDAKIANLDVAPFDTYVPVMERILLTN